MTFDGFGINVRVYVTFTLEELKALHWMARHHYDYTCKSLADVEDEGAPPARAKKGILTSLIRNREWDKEHGEEPRPYRFDFSDIDIFCKAMEGPHLDRFYEKPKVILKLREDLIALIRRMQREQQALNDREDARREAEG